LRCTDRRAWVRTWLWRRSLLGDVGGVWKARSWWHVASDIM